MKFFWDLPWKKEAAMDWSKCSFDELLSQFARKTGSRFPARMIASRCCESRNQSVSGFFVAVLELENRFAAQQRRAPDAVTELKNNSYYGQYNDLISRLQVMP